MYQKFITRFNTISFVTILVVCALLPLFFLPATWGGIGAIKGVLLYGGVFVAFSFWILAQFVAGSLSFPKHKAFIALGAWVVFALVSALTSQNVTVSLWGRGFVVDSFATVLALALLTFLIATFAREQKRLIVLFLATFVGSVVTVFLQVILYVSQKVPFVASHLAHVANQGTLVGSWVDFAHFVTFTFLLSLLMYEVLLPKGIFKVVSLVAMVLSIAVLVFLNFKAAWVIALVSSLLVFVYKSSVERSVAKFFPYQSVDINTDPLDAAKELTPRFPVASFGALIIGLFFFLSSGSIGAQLSQYAGVSFNDTRPSFVTTTHVMRATLARDPLFGIGAGRFGVAWDLHHPLSINQTGFWNTTFDTGFSMLGTTFTTNGILAGIALLALLCISLLHGFRLFNYQFPDRFSRFIAVASLIMFIAFAILFTLTSPGIVLIVFGFMYLGLLLGVSSLVGRTPVLSINYLRDPRMSFFAILVLVLVSMAGFAGAYLSGSRFASIFWYNQALIASDVATAERQLDRAISLSQNDIYWRTRSALFTRQFTDMANTASPDKGLLQTYFTQAEQSARAAVAWDTSSASNWLNLSQVYQLVAGGSTTDGYTNAVAAADAAQERGPMNPVFLLNHAQLAFLKQDTTLALQYVADALVLKSDYLDAYIVRGQIRESIGEVGAVQQEILAYTKVAPFDAQGYFLLGQAYSTVKNYQAALEAYTRAGQLSPNNPNPSLSAINTLITMGDRARAIEALKTLKAAFPGVTGVDEKITELESGSSTPVSTVEEPTPVAEN
ncbi:MAG: tetratricopeptide repeat protein [Candidatus Pacebacteria bacterium]|nr:tetratricopeptide repeat protein [Candidatus Paceibacterota bacterium]